MCTATENVYLVYFEINGVILFKSFFNTYSENHAFLRGFQLSQYKARCLCVYKAIINKQYSKILILHRSDQNLIFPEILTKCNNFKALRY